MAAEKKVDGNGFSAEECMKEFARVGAEYNYRKQGIFFLNAYWAEYGEKEAEKVYEYVQTANELDKKEGENGHAMDEFEVML